MKKALQAIVLLLAVHYSHAQISQGGQPKSFTHRLQPLAAIPLVKTPTVDVPALLAEDAAEAHKGVPPRFGYGFNVSYSLRNSGLWESLPGGSRIWRLQIKSAGALSINLIYNEFNIPRGASLHLYNEDHSQVIGAFTYKNVKPHGQFSTQLVKGETTIVEYYEPAAVAGNGRLNISRIVHGYRDLFKTAKNFGDSGPCNNNVNCPEGMPWQTEKRAVAMIVLSGGTRWCTGALVNNTSQNAIPYFLTANHCLTGTEATWIYYFNYESPNCTNVDGPTNQTVSGSALVASDAPSDFGLLVLDNIPSPSYNTYYAGWDKRNMIKDSTVSIHHPNGDIKKISFDYDNTVDTGYFGPGNHHWGILDWDDGTTEPGSSGAPLFDKKHRILGQLHGGNAACTNNLEDYYGKFSYSWNTGTTPSTRLKEWLDPNNSGTDTLDGNSYNTPTVTVDASMGITTSVNSPLCDSTLDISFVLTSMGGDTLTTADIMYVLDGGLPSTMPWTGSLGFTESETVALPTVSFQPGNHTLVIYATNPNSSVDMNNGNDTVSISFSSIDGNNVVLNLTTDNYGDETSVSLVDSNGSPVFAQGSFPDAMLNVVDWCLADGCYTFTIYDAFSDGICCSFGNGNLNIMLGTDTAFIHDGQFTDSVVTNFCVQCGIVVPVYSDTGCVKSGNIGIVENNSLAFSISPNPTSGAVVLNFNAALPSAATIVVYNSLGAIVSRDTATKGSSSLLLDMSTLDAGMYYTSVITEGSIYSKKIQLIK